MGKRKEKMEMAAMVLCFVGMVVIVQQGGALMSNSNSMKLKEKEIVGRAVPAMATHFCVLTKQEIDSLPTPSSSSSPLSSSSSSSTAVPLSSSPPPTPILDLIGESLTAAIPVVSEHLSKQIIADVVQHAGFFPSNVMQTLQDLLEYDSNLMTSTVSQLLHQIARAYYQEATDSVQSETQFNHLYVKEGNYAQELSQILGVVASVPQLTENTVIPEQDSWLGNFFTSLPNMFYVTAVNTTNWNNGLTSAADLFHNLGDNVWKGVYYSGNDPDQGSVFWVCEGCDPAFHAIEKQATILAQAPLQ